MKLVKNFAFAVVLMSAISVSTLAGDQETPGFRPSPPPPEHSISAPNEVPYGTQIGGNRESAAEATDYLFMEALSVLLSVF
jgi:hypothetical protein